MGSFCNQQDIHDNLVQVAMVAKQKYAMIVVFPLHISNLSFHFNGVLNDEFRVKLYFAKEKQYRTNAKRII